MDLQEYITKQDELHKELDLKEECKRIKDELLETKGYYTNISINPKGCVIELLNTDQVVDDQTIKDFEEITGLNFQKATPNKHHNYHLEFVFNSKPRYYGEDIYDIEVDNPDGEDIVLTLLFESEAKRLIEDISIIEDYLKYSTKNLDFTYRLALRNILIFREELIGDLKDNEE